VISKRLEKSTALMLLYEEAWVSSGTRQWYSISTLLEEMGTGHIRRHV